MKILVIADTHFNKGFSIPANILKRIAETDMIIHCGDFVSKEFYDFLNSSKKLVAVRGNNDTNLIDKLNMEEHINVEGSKISVIHGHFVNLDTLHLKYSDSDIILFGHTHHPSIERSHDKMILNPGSLTSNRYIDYNTFMIIDLAKGRNPEVQIYKTT